MTTTTILLILFLHWIADFVLQSDQMAKNKSKSNYWLSIHVFCYSSVWLVFALFNYGAVDKIIYFYLITLVSHFITDYITSRINTRLYAKGDTHNFFVVIGFDQVLHYTQLILTYELLR